MLEGHALTHFMPLVLFYTLRKHPKTKGFLFSGTTKRDLWNEMGQGRRNQEIVYF